MDAMALLCNLQADGPATLRRLHGIGCSTLGDLEAVDASELAEALASDAAFARRFVREARALAQRFDDVGTEEDSAADDSAAQPLAERDVPAQPNRPETILAPYNTAELAAALAAHVRRPSGVALRAGLVDGLDEAWCKALVGQGIRTLEALRDAPGLPLARSLGRRLTELVGLQCLARRRLDDEGRALALLERDDEPPYVIVPARRPLAEPDDVIFPTERPNAPRAVAARVAHTPAPGAPTADGGSDSGGPFA